MHSKKLEELSISAIMPNRFQPRIHFDEEKIESLAKSIIKYGVLEPIIVRPVNGKYEIIAGERRFKASKLAGKTTIPAVIVDYDDKESIELALLENVQRQELTAIEEAIAYRRILDMGYITQEELAKKTGKSQPTIANKMRLLALDDETQEALINHQISERHARSLLKLSGTKEEVEMLNRIISERLTVRDTDREISAILKNKGDKSKTKQEKADEFFLSKEDKFSNVEKLVNNEEKRGEEKMDIEKIMQEAQNINEEEKPKNMNEFVSTPSPYDTILSSEPVKYEMPEEQNKFINIYPEKEQVEEPKNEEKSNVTFDSIFNSVFENNVSNDTTENKAMEDAILDSLFGETKEEIPSINIEPKMVESNKIEENIPNNNFSQVVEVPKEEVLPAYENREASLEKVLDSKENQIESLYANSQVSLNSETKEEVPSFTSTIAQSAPDFILPSNEENIKQAEIAQEEIPSNEPIVAQPNLEQEIEISNEELALNTLKKCAEELQSMGINVTTNELNLGSIYQFTFNIIK